MEDEVYYEETSQDMYIESTNEDINSDIMDNTDTPSEEVDKVAQDELVDAILHEIAERALTTTSGEEVEQETETIETETIEQTDYTDILDLIESDLDIIAENTTTSSGNTIYTPIKDYELTNLLLLGILIVMLLRVGVEVIKNNVFKLN